MCEGPCLSRFVCLARIHRPRRPGFSLLRAPAALAGKAACHGIRRRGDLHWGTMAPARARPLAARLQGITHPLGPSTRDARLGRALGIGGRAAPSPPPAPIRAISASHCPGCQRSWAAGGWQCPARARGCCSRRGPATGRAGVGPQTRRQRGRPGYCWAWPAQGCPRRPSSWTAGRCGWHRRPPRRPAGRWSPGVPRWARASRNPSRPPRRRPGRGRGPRRCLPRRSPCPRPPSRP
mmetsp:Transcript_1452/g.4568  ORF Transcript_1452/g.4568 Transcript_1452/m.4568 type:complete len:236 (-) Transcript_1452:125-832(-)